LKTKIRKTMSVNYKIVCQYCNTLIDSKCVYCPCCGSKEPFLEPDFTGMKPVNGQPGMKPIIGQPGIKNP
jgi:hypothetical protein